MFGLQSREVGEFVLQSRGKWYGKLGVWKLDQFARSAWPRDSVAAASHVFDVQLNRFADEALHPAAGFRDGDAAW